MMRTRSSTRVSRADVVRPFFAQPARGPNFFSASPFAINAQMEPDVVEETEVPPVIQTKLTIGAPPAEQGRDDEVLQAKFESAAGRVSDSVQRSLEGARGAGRALDPLLRDQMEAAFRVDFSGVRINTDNSAARLNRTLNARAFTSGSDIFFNTGEFRPDTRDGRQLLAHELTHVVQQARHPISPGTTEPVGSHAEREAHDASARVVRGEQPPMPRAVPGGLTRDVGWARRGPVPDPHGMGYNEILSRAGAAAEPAVRALASCEARMDLDVVRFQSLSLAHRRAVLALQPHAAGTACEPWFPRLDPAKLTNAQIEVTAEFHDYMDSKLDWQKKHKMTREEALLAGRLVLRQLREGRSVSWSTDAGLFMNLARKQLGVLRASERQVGNLTWVPFSTHAAVNNPAALPTEFGRWVLAGGPEPNAISGRINCWEMILFGAYRGGFLTFSRIQSIYRLAVDNVRNGRTRLVGDTVETELRRGNVNTFDPSSPTSPEPLPGDMVIFNTAATHAAISLGTKTSAGEHGVLSLWNEPNAISHVQRTTIEALLTSAGSGARPVRFWSANW